jgi:hypothetical protein
MSGSPALSSAASRKLLCKEEESILAEAHRWRLWTVTLANYSTINDAVQDKWHMRLADNKR